jgi:hypothetical protein
MIPISFLPGAEGIATETGDCNAAILGQWALSVDSEMKKHHLLYLVIRRISNRIQRRKPREVAVDRERRNDA